MQVGFDFAPELGTFFFSRELAWKSIHACHNASLHRTSCFLLLLPFCVCPEAVESQFLPLSFSCASSDTFCDADESCRSLHLSLSRLAVLMGRKVSLNSPSVALINRVSHPVQIWSIRSSESSRKRTANSVMPIICDVCLGCCWFCL